VLCEFQYGCLALCGLAPVVVLRSFGDRVEVFTVSVSLSPSLGRIQPWSGIKLVIPAVSTASYLVLKPTVVKIGPSPYQFILVLIRVANRQVNTQAQGAIFNTPKQDVGYYATVAAQTCLNLCLVSLRSPSSSRSGDPSPNNHLP
jgi:hypothetical protein